MPMLGDKNPVPYTRISRVRTPTHRQDRVREPRVGGRDCHEDHAPRQRETSAGALRRVVPFWWPLVIVRGCSPPSATSARWR